MKKVCWLLILVLVIGCFVGCQQAPAAQRPIENEDGTLADWMKEEIEEAYKKKCFDEHGIENATFNWWSPKNPTGMEAMYYGTYDGYVMYCKNLAATEYDVQEILGFKFIFPSHHALRAYKDGEFFSLYELTDQGLLGEEAIRIAYEHYTEIRRIQNEYYDQLG